MHPYIMHGKGLRIAFKLALSLGPMNIRKGAVPDHSRGFGYMAPTWLNRVVADYQELTDKWWLLPFL